MPDPLLGFSTLSGSRRSPQVLMVGPSLGTSVRQVWGDCANRLADRYEVVGWDLPGHGASPITGQAFTIEDLAGAVTGHTQNYADGRPSVYAGASIGGAVGLVLSLEPGPFQAVAAIGSAGKIGDAAEWRSRAALVRREGTAQLTDATPGRWFTAEFRKAHPERVNEMMSSLKDVDDGSYALACEALAEFDIRRDLAAAAVPVLFCVGDHDAVVTPDELQIETATMPSAQVLLLEGCSHLPTVENPDEVAAMLLRFFDAEAP